MANSPTERVRQIETPNITHAKETDKQQEVSNGRLKSESQGTVKLERVAVTLPVFVRMSISSEC